MDLTEINTLSRSSFRPTKQMRDLEENTLYFVTNIKRINTRHGPQTIVALDHSFQVFLPRQVNDLLGRKPKLFQDLCEACESTKLNIHHFKNGFFEFEIN